MLVPCAVLPVRHPARNNKWHHHRVQGLSTYIGRIAPHVIITLLLLEAINKFTTNTLKLK